MIIVIINYSKYLPKFLNGGLTRERMIYLPIVQYVQLHKNINACLCFSYVYSNIPIRK